MPAGILNGESSYGYGKLRWTGIDDRSTWLTLGHIGLSDRKGRRKGALFAYLVVMGRIDSNRIRPICGAQYSYSSIV